MLIDGHSIAYRAFFALPVENFSTVTGQHTNGVFGFTSMLINVLRDEAPTHLGVAFDVSRRTFRVGDLPGVQGEPVDHAGRVPRPARPGQGGAQGPQHRLRGEGGLRGRRRDRHPGHPGRGAGFRRADLHRGPGRVPAGQRQRHRALPAQGRLRPGPDDPEGGRGEVLRHPGALPRSGRAGRGDQRQPARRAGGGAEDRGQVAGDLRRSGEPGRPCRRAEGQGGRGVPGAGRRRAAQPADQRPGARPRPAARPGRPAAPAVGPGGHPSALRRAGVPGAAGPAARGPAERGGDRARGRLRPERGDPGARRAGRLAGRARGRRAHRRRRHRALGLGTGRRHRARPGRRRRGGRVRRGGRARTGGREGAGRLARRPGAAQGDARRQGPAAGHLVPRLGPGRPDLGHPARGLPDPAGPAHVRPGRPDHPVPEARAQGRGGAGARPTPTSCRWTSATTTPGPRSRPRRRWCGPGR